MSGTSPARGRRGGGADTRADILAAARRSFADRGFTGTTIRAVASSAGVDPALVHHFFGSKDDLFVAALEVKVDPRAVISAVAEGGVDGVGERLLRAFMSVWENPESRMPLLAVVRSGIAGEPGRTLVDTALTRFVFGTLGEALDLDEKDRRISLVASQMVGLVVARYVLRLEPLASMSAEEVVAWVGPTVQEYLSRQVP